MIEGNFYTPLEVRPLYDKIVPVYQVAFAGDPWNEVSKCPDVEQRCVGGLSPLTIGNECQTCGQCPTAPAYEADELKRRFDMRGFTRPTSWYIEQDLTGDVTLAAMGWRAGAERIASEKYKQNPHMAGWLASVFRDPGSKAQPKDVLWLDEVFANRSIKPRGNLKQFGAFVCGMAEQLGLSKVAYRTIAPQMTAKPVAVFGGRARVYKRRVELPDHRDFVVINLKGEK